MDEDPSSENVAAADAENPDEDDVRLKGDAIGDTLYSESWVLRTMIHLTQELPKYMRSSSTMDNNCNGGSTSVDDEDIELEESLETDLCLLWDMTADKDVASFISKNEIMSLSKTVVEGDCHAPRLVEIIVGILANISCQEDIAHQIVADSELLTLMFGLLSNKDSQTVIQCIRLLETLLASSESEKVMKMTSSVIIWKDLSFILQNSLNEELLCGASKLLKLIISHLDTESDLSHLPLNDILRGILESQVQLNKDQNSENIPENIREAFDSLTSSLYNLSRIDAMRTIIRDERNSVSGFLESYMKDVLNRLEDMSSTEDAYSLLIASAVESSTLFYIVIVSDISSVVSKLLALTARIGSEMSPDDQYSLDYRDIVGDCMRKLLGILNHEEILLMLEPLDASGPLRFLLCEAQRAVPDKLSELISSARAAGSFNKVVDTFESHSVINHAR